MRWQRKQPLAPDVGQHNDELLKELGFKTKESKDTGAKGMIAPGKRMLCRK
jgi:hypothetical protein